MRKLMPFFQLFSVWILLTYVSAKQEECEKESLIKNDSYHFNYHDFDEWGKLYPLCKKGKQQSPINLGTKMEIYKVDEFPVKIMNYDQKIANGIVQNNGHSVQLKGRWEINKPLLTGAAVHWDTYEFYSIILHWGTSDDSGTEHSIHGKKYAAELHIVQKNVKYPNMEAALKEKYGVIVTALLFQHNKVKPPNKGIQQLARLACSVSETGSVERADFDMTLLDFHAIKHFYTYLGSIARPPCSEHIRWFVSTHLLPIDDESLRLLRSVKLGHNDKSNIRPIQKSHGRKVESYSKIELPCDLRKGCL